MPPLRILIADDHHLIRRGVRTLLEERPEWKICGEAKTGTEAVTKANELKPDIVILDISMPDLGGLEVAKRIRSAAEIVEVLILSMHSSDHLIRECIKAGVRGYIMKSDTERYLVIAVETIAKHHPFFTPNATEVMLDNFHSGAPVTTLQDSIPGILTPREREIVQLIAAGKSSKEIAMQLGIGFKTAETHRSNIMRKLRVHSTAELVRYAVRNRIIEA